MKIIIALLFFAAITVSFAEDWETFYEKSGFKETPRYNQTIDYCKKLASASPMLHLTSFGHSPQLRSLPLLIADKDGLTDPATIRAHGRIVVMIMAGIHPGESEGKDAGMLLLRDIAVTEKYKNLLDNCSILFIPIFNVDGHERWGKYNRINQNGPEEMGWRVNARNLNLNRDFLKAETDEMKQWLALFNEWLPEFFIDCHTTDGADYQYTATYGLEIFGNMDLGLTNWQKDEYLPFLTEKMFDSGHPIFKYVYFKRWHDPRSGLMGGVAPPMISEGYTAIQNRPGLLIETHMLKDYKTRVDATYYMILHSLEYLHKHHKRLQQLVIEADAVTASEKFRSAPFPVRYNTSHEDSTSVEFLGIDYSIDSSELTGGNWFRYNGTPKTFNISYFSDAQATHSVDIPIAYVIPVQWVEIIDRLNSHGISYMALSDSLSVNAVMYRFSNAKWAERPYEGRHRVTFDIETESIQVTLPKGSAVVFTNQRTARVIAYLLEPKAEGSLTEWGFFNPVFEQREYAESYVMEKLAREMLSSDPALAEEFEKWKAENADKLSQWQILNWFYMKTPYWDTQMNLYPVVKIFNPETISDIKNHTIQN